PLSRLRLLPLLNSRPLNVINGCHRSYQHERRIALHEVAFRNRASSALQWPRGRWCVLPLSSPHGQAPLPPPWSIEDANNACFIVRDSTGQALGYFYFEGEPGRRSAAKLLTRDEARRMAANFAKLPELLRDG